LIELLGPQTGLPALASHSFLACFPFGILCGYFRSLGGFERLRQQSLMQVLTILTALAGLAAGTYATGFGQVGYYPP
jgi:hypothetical protein